VKEAFSPSIRLHVQEVVVSTRPKRGYLALRAARPPSRTPRASWQSEEHPLMTPPRPLLRLFRHHQRHPPPTSYSPCARAAERFHTTSLINALANAQAIAQHFLPRVEQWKRDNHSHAIDPARVCNRRTKAGRRMQASATRTTQRHLSSTSTAVARAHTGTEPTSRFFAR